MLYIVFDTQAEVDDANVAWVQARSSAGVCDESISHITCENQVTDSWDTGKELFDGRIACVVPDLWADAFGGIEEDLSDTDFIESMSPSLII